MHLFVLLEEDCQSWSFGKKINLCGQVFQWVWKFGSSPHTCDRTARLVGGVTSMAQMSRTNLRSYLLIGLVSLVIVLQLFFLVSPQSRPVPDLVALDTIKPTATLDKIPVTVSEPPVDASKAKLWTRKRNLAKECIRIHSLPEDGWQSLSTTTLHIVYFVWMPNNGSAEGIIPGQLEDVQNSGLFDRPFTKFYAIVSAQNTSRFEWFKNLDVIKKYQPEIHHTTRNTYEFPGIRFFYELGCQNPSDLFLYFHSKGVRYYRGRIGMEVTLTREIVANWKNMLTLIAAHPASHTYGLGGPGYQWMNFYYARGSLFPYVPKPMVLKNRWWYEEWPGYDISPRFDHTLPAAANSECAASTGFEKAVTEPEIDEIYYPRRYPQYGILRCGTAEVSSAQLDLWSKPIAKETDAAIKSGQLTAMRNLVQTTSV